MMHDLLWNPLFGVTISVITYSYSLRLARKFPHCHPLFISAGAIIFILLTFHIPFEAYQSGGDLLTFFLGPATIALGVPLYKHRLQMRRHLVATLAGVTAGSFTGIIAAGSLVWLLGGSREIALSMLPKSVSSPIAIELSRLVGGIPEMSAVLTVLTGLLGSMFGRACLERLGIHEELPLGIAMGTAAHGIGTAKLIRDSDQMGSYSAFAMALTGIVTGILFIPIVWWLHRG
jgi:predicted murein hydrolase (TIGR00659 family)